MTRKIDLRLILFWLVLLLTFGIGAAGCQSAEQLGFWRERVQQGEDRVAEQRQTVAGLQAALAALPDDSPERVGKEAELTAAREKLRRLEEWREDSRRNLDREQSKPVGEPGLTLPPGTPYGEMVTG